jgi:two-component system LytT family response regulator
VSGLRVLVVDDEPLARRRLRALLRRRREVDSVLEAGDGDEALAALLRERPDLLFLDVQMPGKSGLDVARAIGAAALPTTLFVTAFDRYAVDAFTLHAVDYLLKPFDEERFGDAFEQALRRIREQRLGAVEERLRALLAVTPGAGAAGGEHLTAEKGGRLHVLATGEVEWARAAGNYVEIGARGSTFLVRGTLRAVEARLQPPRFLRIHRSALVQVERIAEVQPGRGEHAIVLRDGTRLPLSRRAWRSLAGRRRAPPQ